MSNKITNIEIDRSVDNENFVVCVYRENNMKVWYAKYKQANKLHHLLIHKYNIIPTIYYNQNLDTTVSYWIK